MNFGALKTMRLSGLVSADGGTDGTAPETVHEALRGVGRPPQRDAALPLRHALLQRHDRLLLPRPARTLHAALPAFTGRQRILYVRAHPGNIILFHISK